jgi:O-antigen/teichoic acid export membrane protein
MKSSSISIRKALSLTFTRSAATFVFNIATVTIVSRLLTPAEIGVFSVTAALVALAQMLRAFGVGELIIQEKNLTPEVVRTAFTMNLVIAGLLALALFSFSGLIGRFYGDPGAAQVARVMSLVFVLMPFGAIPMAYMKREMQFAIVVRIQVIDTAVRSTCTIFLAWIGFSYMSMAWAAVAAMAAVVLGCLVWGGEYRVGGGFGLSEWRRVMHFGTNRTVSDLVASFGAQSANIVVGRLLGMAAAGFYSRGNGIVRTFRANVMSPISSVALPAYARDHREANAAPLLFRKSLECTTGINWPFFAFAALMAFPLIRIAFGSQWDASVPIMRWLCWSAVVGTLIYPCNDMLTAIGRYREVTQVVVQYQIIRVILAVLAAFHSLEAVAASQIVVYVIAVILYYRKLVRYEALRLRALVTALLPSLKLAIATSAVPAAVLVFWPGFSTDHHYVPAFFVAAGGSGIVWLAGVFLLQHPLSVEIRRVWSTMRERMRSVKKAS